jgi:hypothetical protein
MIIQEAFKTLNFFQVWKHGENHDFGLINVLDSG